MLPKIDILTKVVENFVVKIYKALGFGIWVLSELMKIPSVLIILLTGR